MPAATGGWRARACGLCRGMARFLAKVRARLYKITLLKLERMPYRRKRATRQNTALPQTQHRLPFRFRVISTRQDAARGAREETLRATFPQTTHSARVACDNSKNDFSTEA